MVVRSLAHLPWVMLRLRLLDMRVSTMAMLLSSSPLLDMVLSILAMALLSRARCLIMVFRPVVAMGFGIVEERWVDFSSRMATVKEWALVSTKVETLTVQARMAVLLLMDTAVLRMVIHMLISDKVVA